MPVTDDAAAPMRLLVLGCGYSGAALAERVGAARIEGVTTRSSAKAASFAARGLRPFLFDGSGPAEGLDAAIGRATHLLVSVPPGHEAPAGASVGGANSERGDPVLRWYADAIRHGAPALRWIGYLSTIGVYGDHGGGWIDERAPLNGRSNRARERVAAERGWLETGRERGAPTAILRLSGIYGPGRNAFGRLQEGTARRIVKPGQVFNRIHVADIAGAAEHLARRRIGGVFNVTDDEPAPPEDVTAFAANLAGVTPPAEEPFQPETMSAMARSFWSDNKRVANAALRATGYELLFPTFREGLDSLRHEFTSR